MIGKWIIYQNEEESLNLLNQINACEGYPNGTTLTYVEGTTPIFNKLNNDFIGYGIPIFSSIYDCLSEIEIQSILLIDSDEVVFEETNN